MENRCGSMLLANHVDSCSFYGSGIEYPNRSVVANSVLAFKVDGNIHYVVLQIIVFTKFFCYPCTRSVRCRFCHHVCASEWKTELRPARVVSTLQRCKSLLAASEMRG